MDNPPLDPSPPPSSMHQGPARPPAVVARARPRPAPPAGGFGRSVGAFVTAIGVLATVFCIGIAAAFILIAIFGVAMAGAVDESILTRVYRDGGSSAIAIVPVEGVIDGRRAAFVRQCVNRVLDDRSVKAVVLRVNSPGGGVTASDEIWYQIERLRDAGRPVVASYGGVAASGGYYVSCASDFIMAQETSITGSIGVIAQVMTFEGLMDKVGVEPVTLVARRSPAKSVANDVFRGWTDEDRGQVISMLDSAYDIFHTRVADGRKTAITDVDAVATGAVFTSEEALDRGLVDGIGYLDDAIAEAEKQASLGTDSATVRSFHERPSLFGGLPGVRSGSRGALERLDGESIRSLINELGSVRLMYLMH